MAEGDKKKEEGSIAPADIVKVEHKNIYEALSAFQGQLPVIPMDKEVTIKGTTTAGKPFEYKFSYAPLGTIMRIINPILATHGLAVRHVLTKDGINCILTHETYKETRTETGEETMYQSDGKTVQSVTKHTSSITEGELSSGFIQVKQTGEMKDIGGAITYARRYTLGIVLGLASDEDVDAPLDAGEQKVYVLAHQKLIDTVKASDKAGLANHLKFLTDEIGRLERGEAPKMKYTIEQYREVLEVAEARGAELDANPKPEPTVQVGDIKKTA